MQKRPVHLYWLIPLILFIASPTCAKLPVTVGEQPLPSLAPILEKVTPAVVNISSAHTVNNPLFNDPFFRYFFNVPKQKRSGRGSGVIIDAKKGYVVTNNHVIDKADEISITLQDDRTLNATIIGTDPETDVALLQVSAGNLTALPMANSEQLRVGDFVVAIGNPFGLGQTVTSGIISALGRSGLGIEGYEDFIQTDASINPGNSGGALINLQGELIGINTAIIAPGGGNVGIGFAIPINMVRQVISHLAEFGEVRRGIIGIEMQDLTPDLISAFGLTEKKGAAITKVVPNTPADQAGLEPGDIIIAINNQPVKTASDIRNRVGLLRVGEKVKITVIREKRTLNLTAVIADTKTVKGKEVSQYLEGASLSDSNRGIEIREVAQGSIAQKVGFQKGDTIVGFNRRKVKNIADLTRRFVRQSSPYLIQIQREDSILSLWLN
jgi:Do/DeqQ family serine protease